MRTTAGPPHSAPGLEKRGGFWSTRQKGQEKGLLVSSLYGRSVSGEKPARNNNPDTNIFTIFILFFLIMVVCQRPVSARRS